MIGALHIPILEFHEEISVPPLKAMVIGNNAVGNLEMFTAFRTVAEGLAGQVAQGQQNQNALAARWMECDERYSTVHFSYVHMINSDAWTDVEETLEAERPDVVILDVLGNDLAELQEACTPITVAERAFDLAYRMQHNYGAKVVDIMGGIRRTAELDCTPEEYAQRIQQCEAHLQHETSSFFNIDFVRMRGFTNYINQQQMAVAYFSDNGIYPGASYDSYGFQKYHQNIKRALRDGVGKWATGRRLNLY